MYTLGRMETFLNKFLRDAPVSTSQAVEISSSSAPAYAPRATYMRGRRGAMATSREKTGPNSKGVFLKDTCRGEWLRRS